MKIKINNKLFFFFNNFTVSMNLDSVASSFAFVAKFNPQNKDHLQLFKPAAFQDIQVFKDSGELLLTGTIVTHSFNSNSNPELVKISGYSKGGVLEDCTTPYSLYPLESNNRTLKEIFSKYLDSFNLSMRVDATAEAEANLIFPKSIASPTESIVGYLSKLTAQKNILLSHNEKGEIVLFKPSFNEVPRLFINAENCDKMSLSVNGQAMHSEVTIIRQPSSNNKNLSPVDTVSNNFVKTFRPIVGVLTSGSDTDTLKAAKNSLAAEIQAITIDVSLPRFYNLIPGDLVEVQNEEIFIFKRTKFVIQSLSFNEDNSKQTTKLSLCLPEAFTGEAAKNIFE